MGTFAGHVVPGLAITLLGLWNTLNTIASYNLRGPSGFRSRTWYPLPAPPYPALRYLELLLLLSFSALALASQFLDLSLLRLSSTPDGLEHATMFLHLLVYASAALATELPRPATTVPHRGALRSLVGVLAANVFAQELFLLRFHSVDRAGVEGHYHWLLQLAASASLLASVAAAGAPGSFPAALVRSVSVVVQGVWLVVMGFALWVPRLAPKGCYAGGGGGAVACGTAEADARARVMGNLQLSWVVAAVSVFTAGLCLRHGGDPAEYRQLAAGGGVDVQVSPAREEMDLKPAAV